VFLLAPLPSAGDEAGGSPAGSPVCTPADRSETGIAGLRNAMGQAQAEKSFAWW
jgi:hypothetical protein